MYYNMFSLHLWGQLKCVVGWLLDYTVSVEAGVLLPNLGVGVDWLARVDPNLTCGIGAQFLVRVTVVVHSYVLPQPLTVILFGHIHHMLNDILQTLAPLSDYRACETPSSPWWLLLCRVLAVHMESRWPTLESNGSWTFCVVLYCTCSWLWISDCPVTVHSSGHIELDQAVKKPVPETWMYIWRRM